MQQQLPHLLEYKGPGVHFFDISTIPLKLTSIQYYVVNGVLEDGQYQFPIQMKFAPNVRVGGIEIAENTQAHTELIEVGIPSVASAAAVDRLGSNPTSQLQPYTSGSGSAPLHLIWHDPINIWVVEVFDILHWNYNGSTTTITSNTSSTYDYDHWLSADGWSRLSHTASDGYSLGGYQAWDSTNAAFTNPIFCQLSHLGNGPTSIGVTYNEANGYADGTRGASILTSVSGGALNFLTISGSGDSILTKVTWQNTCRTITLLYL